MRLLSPCGFCLLALFGIASPGIAASSQRTEASDSQLKVSTTFEELATALSKAYEASSTEELNRFFEQWHEAIPPRQIEEIDDDIVQDVYSVYVSFFRQLSEAEDINGDVKYVIVQDSIRYKSGMWPFAKDSVVEGFRPPIQMESARVLYSTEGYKRVLLDFLGPEGPAAVPEENRDEVWKRCDFLKPFIYVVPYHWWNGWIINSFPYVSRIVFNPFRTKATVYYAVGYEGGKALMRKKGDNWVLKKYKFTWVE